jgi:hypothetical protein
MRVKKPTAPLISALYFKEGTMSLQDIDSSFQYGEDPPWADDSPEIDRAKANTELESGQRILHPTSGLYCEHGLGPYKKETHIFLSKEDNVPMQICKSALEVAAFLGGYSRAVGEYLPVIIAAVSLAPKDGAAYKLLSDFIYRNKSCYSVIPEPELVQDSSKMNETSLIFDSWTCSFCGGTYADRALAIKHALGCDENEDVHSCATCASYEIGEDSRNGYRHICKGNRDRIDTWMKHCPEWIGK